MPGQRSVGLRTRSIVPYVSFCLVEIEEDGCLLRFLTTVYSGALPPPSNVRHAASHVRRAVTAHARGLPRLFWFLSEKLAISIDIYSRLITLSVSGTLADFGQIFQDNNNNNK